MVNPFKQYDSEENRKAYELEQRRRALERRIRNTKREVMTRKTAVDNTDDPVLKSELEKDYQRKAALLQKQNKEYNSFCEQNGLKKLNDRLSIAKWDRQQAAAARGAARKYNNANNVTILKEKISDGSITTKINHEKQAPHMYETRMTGKSYFKEGVTEEMLQQIINEKSGTGFVYIHKNGQIKEIVDYDNDIAVNVLQNSLIESDTNRFTIHYSKKRTHVVPAKKKEER